MALFITKKSQKKEKDPGKKEQKLLGKIDFFSLFYTGKSGYLKSKTNTMPLELLTTSDLLEFRLELLNEFKQLLSQKDIPNTGRLLKSGEVRAMLRISRGTLQNLRRNQTLKFTKVGGIIYYDYHDIQKLVKSGKG